MTQEELFKSYIEDPLIVERGYLTKEEVDNISLSTHSNVKIVQVFRRVIDCNDQNIPPSSTIRQINQIFK